MNRRKMLVRTLASIAVACGSRTTMAQETPLTTTPPVSETKKIDKGPPLPDALVKEFVGAAHGDLEKVKSLLAEHPSLINACWDWGGGDYETALGGAAHMGKRDIAEYLLAHGARLDLFAAAMLDKLPIVQAAVEAFPDAIATPGPHGIPLLRHAEMGGAEAVVKYLEMRQGKAINGTA